MLKKVIRWRVLYRHSSCLLRGRIEYLEAPIEVLVQFQYRRHVATSVAVIGSAPHGNEGVVEHRPVALHHELVGAGDEVQVVPLVEHGHDVAAEQIPGPARRQAPPVDLLRVGPEQIAHGPVVGHLLLPVDDADLVEGVDAGAQSAVDGEDLILDDGRKAEVVKYLRAVLCRFSEPIDSSFAPSTLHDVIGNTRVRHAEDERIAHMHDNNTTNQLTQQLTLQTLTLPYLRRHSS